MDLIHEASVDSNIFGPDKAIMVDFVVSKYQNWLNGIDNRDKKNYIDTDN